MSTDAIKQLLLSSHYESPCSSDTETEYFSANESDASISYENEGILRGDSGNHTVVQKTSSSSSVLSLIDTFCRSLLKLFEHVFTKLKEVQVLAFSNKYDLLQQALNNKYG